MKRLIEWFHVQVTALRVLPHFIVVVDRQTRGRWYYFRDRPLWFVVCMADLPLQGGEDEGLQGIVTEAKAELERRVGQTLRDVATADAENGRLRAEIDSIREKLKKLGA